MTTILTSITTNYLPKVRVLARSIKRLHPEFRVVCLLCDEIPAWLDLDAEPFDDLMTLETLGLANWRAFAFKHSLVEVCTAAKPLAIRRLLAEGAGRVLFFDPDIAVFSDLSWLVRRVDEHGIVLTPTLTSPETTRRAILENELSCLKYGMFNLGFIGLDGSPEAMRFARWWDERLQDFCHDDVANGLFTDQRWVDFVPVFFPSAHTLRETHVNVAPWNLADRRVTGSLADGFRVNGEPLCFYHFSAIDRLDHHSHDAKLERQGPDAEALKALVAWYRAELERCGQRDVGRTPWAFARYSDGTPIPAFHRVLYRTAPGIEQRFPEPARRDLTPNFHDWVREHHPFGVEAEPWGEFARSTLRRAFAHAHRNVRPGGWQSRLLREAYETLSTLPGRSGVS